MRSKSIYRVTVLVSFLAVLFVLFFQISKTGPFRQANPFLEDPYDAVAPSPLKERSSLLP
jgi:hypothetical protein